MLHIVFYSMYFSLNKRYQYFWIIFETFGGSHNILLNALNVIYLINPISLFI